MKKPSKIVHKDHKVWWVFKKDIADPDESPLIEEHWIEHICSNCTLWPCQKTGTQGYFTGTSSACEEFEVKEERRRYEYTKFI